MKKLYQFNTGLIRQLKQVLLDKLEKERTELIRIKQNEVRVEEVIQGIIDGIHTVSNNLKMAKLAEWQIAQKIEEVLFLIKNKSAPPESLESVIEIIGVFSEYLENKIDKLSRNGENDFYPMELWNEWERLKTLLDEKAKPQDLFNPFAEFSEEESRSFIDVDPNLLREKTTIAYQDYIAGANDWLNSRASHEDVKDAQLALKKMYNVVKYFAELKTKIGFQGYLLALEARLLMAFSSENAELDKKKNLTQIIQASFVELQNFRNNEKNASLAALKLTLDKFLIQKYYENIKDENIIKEVLERFNIQKFLDKASLVINKEEKNRKEEFKKHYNNIRKTIEAAISSFEALKESYNANKKEDEDRVFLNPKSVETYLVFSNSLSKYAFLMNEDVRDVFGIFGKLDHFLREQFNNNKEIHISNFILEEFGGLFYILQNYINNKEDVNKDFIYLFKGQAIRAEKSLNYEHKYLLTNKLDWTIIGQANYKENYRKIYKNLKTIIADVKRDFYLLSDDGVKDKAKEIIVKSSHILAILVMAKLKPTARLIDYLREVIIDKVKMDKYIFNNEERETIIKVLQKTEVFVEALEKGDERPNVYIKDIYESIFKQDIEQKVNTDKINKVNYQQIQKESDYRITEEFKKSSLSVNLMDSEEDLVKPKAEISYVNEDSMINGIQEKSKEELPQVAVMNHKHLDEIANFNEENKENEVIQTIEEEYQENVVEEFGEREQIEQQEEITQNNLEDVEIEQTYETKEVEEKYFEHSSENVEINFGEDLNDQIEISENTEVVELTPDYIDDLGALLEQYQEELVPTYENNIHKLYNYDLSLDQYENHKKEIKRIAHSLKGDTRQLGMYKLGEVFEKLEYALKDKLGSNKYLTKDFINNYQDLFKFATQYIEQLNSAIENGDKVCYLEIDKDIVDLYVEEFKTLQNQGKEEFSKNKEVEIEFEQPEISEEVKVEFNDNIEEIENEDISSVENISEDFEQTIFEEHNKEDLISIENNEQPIEQISQFSDFDIDAHEDLTNKEEVISENEALEEEIDNRHEYEIEEDKNGIVEDVENNYEDYIEENTIHNQEVVVETEELALEKDKVEEIEHINVLPLSDQENEIKNVETYLENVVDKVEEGIAISLNNSDLDVICESLQNISNEILKLKSVFEKMKSKN